MAKHAHGGLDRALRLSRTGDRDAAETELQRFLQHTPDHADAWTMYGQLLDQRGESARAETAYVRAIECEPRTFTARVNLGVLLERRGVSDQALAHYEAALAIRPDDAHALRNFGGILRRVGALDRALEVLTRAAELAPEDAGARTNLGLTLSSMGRHDEATFHLAEAVRIRPDEDSAHHARLLTLHYASEVSPEEVAAAHRAYGAMIEKKHAPLPPARRRTPATSTLRLGFVSADLRRHSVAFFLEPLLAHLSRTDFEVFAYSTSGEPDEVTVRLREHIAVYRDVRGLSEDALAGLIRADGIDVLVDLNGHTAHNALAVFARKPAPVQLTYLGYPNSTGLTRIDYRLTDEEADPIGQTDALHTERLLRLKGGFLCYLPPVPSPEVADCPSGPHGPVTFGSFNALTKMSDHVLALWARLLHEEPTARLIVKQLFLSSASGRSEFERRLRRFDVPLTRVELLGNIADTSNHLATYGRIDIALDAYPYHGTTTTCDALWMGVPVVSLLGRAHVSRVGLSLLSRVGLADLAATSDDEYVAKARALAGDFTRRSEIRHSLRKRMAEGGLLDGERLAREFTRVVRDAYGHYLETPDSVEMATPANDQTQAPSDATMGMHSLPLPDQDARWLALPRGLLLAAPKSLDSFEGYVLEEQGDWYEDEIHFARTLVQPGDRVLDLGAGSGVYALSMAERAGPAGAVQACTEQTRDVARLLASARANKLRQLSAEGGLPTLEPGAKPLQFVRVSPSDVPECSVEELIAVCKQSDPLIMVECARDPARAEVVLSALLADGAGLYRLVPGLGLLYPQLPGADTDPLLCNLFVASKTRAQALAARGLLAESLGHLTLPEGLRLSELFESMNAVRDFDADLAFFTAEGGKELHRQALLLFTLSRRTSADPSLRAYALHTALDVALSAIEDPTDVARLSTLARIAAAWGMRALAVEALDTALTIHRSGNGRLAEPFVPACPRYDDMSPGARLPELAIAAMLEQRERLSAYSSFFTRDDPESFSRLQRLSNLGFQNAEMAKRLSLVRKWRDAAPQTKP